ncbi:MAG TPA: hypothetical protein VLD37_01930 [Candidatus Bilamarchaeum sp.]|nr:hypothetical protein [Candidatus Bilamarchaeum sp.]
MRFLKRAELVEYIEGEQCRLKASRIPVYGATYEVWFTRGQKRFHEKGRYPEVEGLMIKEEASAFFYRMLVQAAKKIGDGESSRMDLSPAALRCVCSLSMWSQDIATISSITGIGLEQTRSVLFGLYHAGYVTLVEKGGRTMMALTPKGWRAEDELASDGLRTELLNQAISIYSAREAEHLKASRPHV